MATEAHEGPVRAAKIIVLGLGALALVYVLAAPLMRYAAVVACALLLGVALWSVASGLARRTRLPYGASLALVLLVLVGAIAGFVAWTGPRVADQFRELETAVGEGVDQARAWFEGSSVGREVQERVGALDEQISSRSGEMIGAAQRGVASGISLVADIVIVIFLGVFFAASPRRYVEGALLLAPRPRRARLREVIHGAVGTLRSWFVARLFLMVMLGIAFGGALAIMGVPLALPIGVLTGALAFIPFLGAILSLLPALAVAFLQGPDKALQVLVVYLVLQFIDTNIVEPVVESRAVRLPPALVVLAQLVSVVYFGAVGVLIATPLLVVVVVAVHMLYLEDVLGEPEKQRRERPHPLRWIRSRLHRAEPDPAE